MKKEIMTLGFISKGDKVLLAMKKRGFGKGRWNGFGGKVGGSESAEESLKRELFEEAKVKVKEFDKRGVLKFKSNNYNLEVHIFHISKFSGSPVETDEMIPRWFSKEEIPFKEMWPDDKHWLPIFISGRKFMGTFSFDDKDNLLDYKLNVVNNF